MLVWLDRSGCNKLRRPEWFDDDAPMAGMPSSMGYLWTPQKYAPMLCYRQDVTWHDVGGDWQVAQYSDFEPEQYERRLDCALWIAVIDVDGARWNVPAILRPDGLPAIGMKNRAKVVDGALQWERAAPSTRLARALECAQELRPHAEANFDTLESTEQLLDGMLAILEASYNLGAGTIAALGLMGDVLLYKGCKMSCAVLEEVDGG